MTNIFTNKKAASVDNIFIIISFFGLVLLFLAMSVFWNAVSTDMDDFWGKSATSLEVKANGEELFNNLDWICTFAWFALHLGVIVTAYLLRTHPVMYVISIFMIIVVCILSAPISNAWEDLHDDAELSVAIADFPMTNFIISKLPMFEVIWSFLTAIAMFTFAKYEGII